MINLLPPQKLIDIRLAHSNTVLRRYIELILISAVVLIGAFVAAHYFLSAQGAGSKETLRLNNTEVAKLSSVQKEAEQLSAAVNTIASLQSRNIKFSEMLTQIGGLMPEGSVLTGLQFSIEDLDSPLVISAQLTNEQTAAILRNNLASSQLFSKAEIQTINATEQEAPAPAGENTDSATTDLRDSQYKYSATINAYFKNAAEKKK